MILNMLNSNQNYETSLRRKRLCALALRVMYYILSLFAATAHLSRTS